MSKFVGLWYFHSECNHYVYLHVKSFKRLAHSDYKFWKATQDF